MKIYNEKKEQILKFEDLDFEKGYLIEDKILLPEVKAVDEKFHYEIIREYENGGKDVKKVIDQAGIKYQPAREEKIKVYRLYTKEDLDKLEKEKRYNILKCELAKIKEDIEQETFGIVRNDYAAKKMRAAEIINALRLLEGKPIREVK